MSQGYLRAALLDRFLKYATHREYVQTCEENLQKGVSEGWPESWIEEERNSLEWARKQLAKLVCPKAFKSWVGLEAALRKSGQWPPLAAREPNNRVVAAR